MVSAAGRKPARATHFAWTHARDFVRSQWPVVVWFAAGSLCRIAATIAAILLIRDFLTGVLSEPSGLAGRLTIALGPAPALWVVVGLLLGVLTASAVSSYGSQLAMHRLIRLFELALMQKLITHLLRLPVSFFDGRRRGDLIESVRQDVSKTRSANAAFVESFMFAAQAAAYGAAALWLSPRLVLLSLPVLLLAAAPGKWFIGRIRRSSRQARRHGYRLTDLLLQLFQGIRVVKIYAGEELETRNSLERGRRYFNELVAAARTRALEAVILETAGGLSVVLVIVIGGLEVIGGRLSIPSLVAVLVAIRAMHGPLHGCFDRVMEVQVNWASLERVHALLQTEPELADRPYAVALTGPFHSLRFENVSFGYQGSARVLNNMTFEVRAGQQVGIVGPSGTGKTTLLSLVARFYDPVEGTILLNGRDLRDYRIADVHRQLALVTQDLFVFGTSVRENIRYGSITASDAEVECAAAAAEIHDDILGLPEGYDTVLGVGGRLLSAGQVQRINIARAMLKNAQIVMLDEATSNLDSISESRIQAALERLMRGRTTLTITHRVATLKRADMILVVDRDARVMVGDHETLLSESRVYRELWHAHQQAGSGEPVKARA
jgi:ABC-type multidrug transport system fused ATPase/permease subunit